MGSEYESEKVKNMRIETIPVDKIFVSPLNVRAEEEFGTAPEDEALKENVRRSDIKQLITVRPKGGKYEVILGRRRFLSIKDSVKEIPCVVRDEWDDREAIKASLIENMDNFQRPLDPITRAEALNRLISMTPSGMTGVARELGIPKSSMSEYLKVLELSPKLKEQVRREVVPFKEAVHVARLELGEDLQNSLAELAVSKGLDALRNEVERLKFGRKRGAPPGLLVVRLVFDPRSREERAYYETLVKLSESKQMNVADYCKSVLVELLKNSAKSA